MISLEQINAYNQSITSDIHAAIEKKGIKTGSQRNKTGEGDTRGATTPRQHKPTTAVLTKPPPPGNKSRR
ncbi:hypothetical protein Bca4012_046458 [Brassica carinata]